MRSWSQVLWSVRSLKRNKKWKGCTIYRCFPNVALKHWFICLSNCVLVFMLIFSMCWKRASLFSRYNIFERASAFKIIIIIIIIQRKWQAGISHFTFYNLVSRDPKITISPQWKSALIDQKSLRKKYSSHDKSKVL